MVMPNGTVGSGRETTGRAAAGLSGSRGLRLGMHRQCDVCRTSAHHTEENHGERDHQSCLSQGE